MDMDEQLAEAGLTWEMVTPPPPEDFTDTPTDEPTAMGTPYDPDTEDPF